MFYLNSFCSNIKNFPKLLLSRAALAVMTLFTRQSRRGLLTCHPFPIFSTRFPTPRHAESSKEAKISFLVTPGSARPPFDVGFCDSPLQNVFFLLLESPDKKKSWDKAKCLKTNNSPERAVSTSLSTSSMSGSMRTSPISSLVSLPFFADAGERRQPGRTK